MLEAAAAEAEAAATTTARTTATTTATATATTVDASSENAAVPKMSYDVFDVAVLKILSCLPCLNDKTAIHDECLMIPPSILTIATTAIIAATAATGMPFARLRTILLLLRWQNFSLRLKLNDSKLLSDVVAVVAAVAAVVAVVAVIAVIAVVAVIAGSCCYCCYCCCCCYCC